MNLALRQDLPAFPSYVQLYYFTEESVPPVGVMGLHGLSRFLMENMSDSSRIGVIDDPISAQRN